MRGALEQRSVWWAMLVGLYLRAWLTLRWPDLDCLRDECTYGKLAGRIVEGQGMTVPSEVRGWLWAPAYPYLLAAHEWVFGVRAWIRVSQILLVIPLLLCAWAVARRATDVRGANATAWLLALSPTLVFFAGRQWSETVYVTLLFGALAALGWARDGSWKRAILPGILVGGCVLLRGVATYMLPLFAIGLLWERWREKQAWGASLALVLGAVLTVAPYSISASNKFGGRITSDLTMGQMMWLGNNDFPPITFDYKVGIGSSSNYDRVTATGRPHCDSELGVVAWDACERENGVAWIKENPGEFLRRIPEREAQLFNPNSFLTRHIRQGRFPGLHPVLAEALCLLTVFWAFLAVVGGSLGAAARGRSWTAVVTTLIVLYHVAAIGLLAGLSRYRVPLDALWLVWAGVLVADPMGVLRRLRGWRLGLALLACALALPLMGWYLVPGYR